MVGDHPHHLNRRRGIASHEGSVLAYSLAELLVLVSVGRLPRDLSPSLFYVERDICIRELYFYKI